jgi:hypothetical protein
MNWEMISAIGQMLGALGVIISLIYLAVQIRAQKKESERAAVTSLTTQFNEFMRPQIESSELCAIWLRGLRSLEQLDGPSKLRFGSYIGRQLRAANSLYLAYRGGTLDARVWRGFEPLAGGYCRLPRVSKLVADSKHWVFG